jgi:hypothetical protein
MYRDFSKRLYRQDYLKGVEGFINFLLSNLKNINESEIRCLCVKCMNKKFHHKNIVMMHLNKKRFVEKYLCWLANKEPYVLTKPC